MPSPAIERDVALAPLTSFNLGGKARYFVNVRTEPDLIDALRWARTERVPVAILGGGSNVIVPDEGFGGLVVRIALQGLRCGEHGQVEAQAGVPWEQVVDEALGRNWAGIECLSGIPGSVGATPIQNVGAYGQQVSEVITAVRVLRTESLTFEELSPASCGFSYRDSHFKRRPGVWIVCAVAFQLRPGGEPTLCYPELQRTAPDSATLEQVRRAVRSLRRQKSMLLDPTDPNRRSAGSFFLNPILSAAKVERLIEQAVADGITSSADEVPRYSVGEGRLKVAAGWLIEKAGFDKGLRRGPVGLSSHHALALVHHGGGSTAELLAFAGEVQSRVQERFGIRLEREPTLLR